VLPGWTESHNGRDADKLGGGNDPAISTRRLGGLRSDWDVPGAQREGEQSWMC
jgi:hypothetical protein